MTTITRPAATLSLTVNTDVAGPSSRGRTPQIGVSRRMDGSEDAEDIVRSSLWFEDGSIVIQAESTQFLIHRSVLSFHSQVFRDMFLLPQSPDGPNGMEMVDGRPLVRLPDTAEEVELMLWALYDLSRISNKQLLSIYPSISAALRLGTKYLIPPLRKIALSTLLTSLPSGSSSEALAHFTALSFPTTFPSPSIAFSLPSSLPSLFASTSPTVSIFSSSNLADTPFPPHLLYSLANLLSVPAHSALSALPAVLYWIAVTHSYPELMDPTCPLSPENRRRAVVGKDALAAEHNALMARMLFYLDPLPKGCLSAHAHTQSLSLHHASSNHTPSSHGHGHAHHISTAFSHAAHASHHAPSVSISSLGLGLLGVGVSPSIPAHLAPHSQPACRAAMVDELLAWHGRQHYQLFYPWDGKMENFLRGGVCEVCFRECAERYEAGKRECWERLPRVFGIGEWEDLVTPEMEAAEVAGMVEAEW